MKFTNSDCVNEKMYRKMFLQDYDPLPWQLTWQLKYQMRWSMIVHVKCKVIDQVIDQVNWKVYGQINLIKYKITQEINK